VEKKREMRIRRIRIGGTYNTYQVITRIVDMPNETYQETWKEADRSPYKQGNAR